MDDLSRPNPSDCVGSLHPHAIQGIRFFNAGEYWKAHEALETAWLEEKGQVRQLYRGILQVGVAYYHVQHGNYRGAVKVILSSQRWLGPFPAFCRGISVEQLRQDANDVLSEIIRLGPERIRQFDLNSFKPLVWEEKR